jgi:hypothetical protein
MTHLTVLHYSFLPGAVIAAHSVAQPAVVLPLEHREFKVAEGAHLVLVLLLALRRFTPSLSLLIFELGHGSFSKQKKQQ